MELRVLQYFLAVAREQSISAAAESLHLSQPTLSTQLKALEEELGKQLLIRGTKGSRKVLLTDEGMILRKRAEEILQLVRKTKDEITQSDDTVAGSVFIGAGETDAMRLITRIERTLQEKYPLIRFEIQSGDKITITEGLDKGLLDFGLIFGEVDTTKYEFIEIPYLDTWGVLMRKDSPLAEKERIEPKDLWDKPLILSRQEAEPIRSWFQREKDSLHIAGTYNLLFNASLMVEEGIGYAICLDNILNTGGESRLCFRPLYPKVDAGMCIAWKKYQVFSKASEMFLQQLEEMFEK